ncbi:putative disease resistance protein RGA3 [Brachypodium distachyon]|uniref:putative disease resistance protein RGA3 n=1 Tax=Brachypodium distachyon TaxID=15368 RepID=UPI000D0DF234|nr:putative disease resistance protein RGA3 [Brachypodium distachyon]|eukprot:XP_024314620.1 putative disease resistance protein RGA3 [Brachypodium distachyon]
MEVVISAVLGDVISRSISFFVDRYHRLQTGGAEQSLEQLRSVLLRIQAIVEEAERRNITNQAMLQQLDTLRHGMYRGYYVLDVFTCRGHSDGDAAAKDEVSNHSFVLSRFNPAKRLHLSAQSPQNMVFDGKGLNELRKALCGLEMIVTDMAEFVVFLKSYPPVSRQPCSSYLFSDMYMFGRHTEYERIVSFLLQIGPPGTGNCSVLPIVGPVRIGKTTLVEHVCYDDRVRSYFSSIVFFSGDDLECMTVKANTLQDSGVIKYRNGASDGRLLMILELIGDLENETWGRLCSSLSHMAYGSKIIVTSRSERIMRFGTTQALQLNVLPQEAYWYLFKMVALRSAGPEDYLQLSSIAMEIAAELNSSFSSAYIIGTLLRANPVVWFWRKVLEHIREFTAKHLLMFGEHPISLLQKDQPIYIWRMTGNSEALMVIAHRCYQLPDELQHNDITPYGGEEEALSVA